MDTTIMMKENLIDTVPKTKIIKIDTFPDGTTPDPEIYMVPAGEQR